MTATDPRPRLAAALAARLAPAAEALAAAYAEDMDAGPPPPDDRARAECHRARRKFVGRLTTPEYRAWRERQRRRTEDSLARYPESAGSADPDGRKAMTETPPHDKT